MSVQLKSRFPGGNGRFLGLETSGSEPELFFAPESHGGAEALWFNVRLEDQAPTAPLPQQLRITIPYADTLVGAGELHALRPAYHPEGKGWFRASAGAVAVTPDGRQAITWTIPYPELPTQFALCYPYGRRELKGLIDKSKYTTHKTSYIVPILPRSHLKGIGRRRDRILCLVRDFPTAWALSADITQVEGVQTLRRGWD
jgi:hypothetical protein